MSCGISLFIVSFLVIVIVSDFSYLIIPDEVTSFFSIFIIAIQLVFNGWEYALSSCFFGLFLFFLMYLIMYVGSKLMNEEALGGGDVKLMFFVGAALNTINPIDILNFSSYFTLLNGFFEIFLSCLIASPFALFNYFSKKGRAIPFGPFILFALLIVYLTSFDILNYIKPI